MYKRQADSSYLGLVSNYNVLDADSINYLGDNITFQEWQGLGHDLNSYNTNPNLKSSTELWPISPSNAIGKGLNLGTSFNEGLAINSIWPNSVRLSKRVGSWYIGAYQISTKSYIKNSGKFIKYNGSYIK